MKRLGMVLLGLMFWSMNTLAQADCGTPPRVLAPGKHSVLLFDQPFVVQWQDDDKCLGSMVKIETFRIGEPNELTSIYALASETENKGHYEVWGDNVMRSVCIGTECTARIQISNAYDDSISIESKMIYDKNKWIREYI